MKRHRNYLPAIERNLRTLRIRGERHKIAPMETLAHLIRLTLFHTGRQNW